MRVEPSAQKHDITKTCGTDRPTVDGDFGGERGVVERIRDPTEARAMLGEQGRGDEGGLG